MRTAHSRHYQVKLESGCQRSRDFGEVQQQSVPKTLDQPPSVTNQKFITHGADKTAPALHDPGFVFQEQSNRLDEVHDDDHSPLARIGLMSRWIDRGHHATSSFRHIPVLIEDGVGRATRGQEVESSLSRARSAGRTGLPRADQNHRGRRRNAGRGLTWPQ